MQEQLDDEKQAREESKARLRAATSEVTALKSEVRRPPACATNLAFLPCVPCLRACFACSVALRSLGR